MNYLRIAVLIAVVSSLTLTSAAQNSKVSDSVRPCVLVRPSEGLVTAFGRVGGGFEYLDSVNMTETKMSYKKRDLEKLQQKGVHVVVVQRDAKRDEIKQARESCTEQEKN